MDMYQGSAQTDVVVAPGQVDTLHVVHQQEHHSELEDSLEHFTIHQEPSQSHHDPEVVRAKLEEFTFQLNNLNNSDAFRGRCRFSVQWKVCEKTQDFYLYIVVSRDHPETPVPGQMSFVPTFHLVAVCTFENVHPDILLRLVAYNGKILEQFDEKLSDLQNNLTNSKLLPDFATNNFSLCHGLAKVALKTQVVLLKNSNFLREQMNDKVVWRSSKCHYAIEKSLDGILLNCCDQCRTILETREISLDANIKNEPQDVDDSVADIFEDLFKPHLNLEERLDFLKRRGISVNEPRKKKQSAQSESDNVFDVELDNGENGNEEDDEEDISPNMMVTVTMKEGDETKVISLDTIRQMRLEEQMRRRAENERRRAAQQLQQQNSAKKRKRAPPAPREILSPEEKRAKIEQQKVHDEMEKEAIEKINSHVKKCPICQEPFSDVNDFMTHLSKCNISEDEDEEEDNTAGEMELDENGIPRPKAAKPKKKKKKKRAFPLTALSCGICGQTFKFETHYEPHVKAHEERLQLDLEVVCPICKETLPTKRHLNPHFKKEHPADGACCVECLQIMDVGNLKLHMQKVHNQMGAASGQKDGTKGEGHLCPDCGKKCQYLSELEIHMAIQHMGIALERPSTKEEEVMCHECGKVFNHRYRLKQHLSTTHNKSRDHPCPFCAKVFCLKHQLTKHLLTHSDVKPFKCKYCDYQNVRKYRVQKHCQKAHNVAGTDQDIDIMEGGSKPSEFVQNFLNIPTGKPVAKIEPRNEMPDELQPRMMF